MTKQPLARFADVFFFSLVDRTTEFLPPYPHQIPNAPQHMGSPPMQGTVSHVIILYHLALSCLVWSFVGMVPC